MKIIYPSKNPDSLFLGISVIYPTGEVPIEQVALKDVPAGVPYSFIDDANILSDREFRDAWEADFSNPDGYGIGHDAWVLTYKIGNKNNDLKTIPQATKSTNKVKINLDKAKKIHSARIALEAEEYLKDVNSKMMDAIIDNDKPAQQALKALKKALTDVLNDPAIANSKSPEELKNAVPEIIKNYRLTKLK